MDKRKALVFIIIPVFFTLGLISLPAANELARRLRAPEAYAKLGEAVTLLKRKAERYRYYNNKEPESFKELLAFEPDRPPYYQLNTVGFLEWERRRALIRPEWESFKDAPDFSPSLSKIKIGQEEAATVVISLQSQGMCQALAEHYLKSAAFHDVLKASWYRSFRVSRMAKTDSQVSSEFVKELTFKGVRESIGGPTQESLAQAREVCDISKNDLDAGRWQIEWVGL